MLDVFSRLSLALGLGLLVGLQRQRTDARIAGFRTFPLVTLGGALCGFLAQELGGWIVAGGLVALALVILGGDLPLLRRDDEELPGVTTEVTMLVMFAIGAYLAHGAGAVAIVTCGAVVVLLHLKPQMHSFAEKIGDDDFRAIMQFALISLVILPVLPNRAYGPFAVLNPFKLWLMVVLIVGLSLGGYVAFKLLGPRAGAWASGVLGGLISSTATTASVARRSRTTPGSSALPVFVIMIASAVVFLRVALLVGATEPRFFRSVIGPCLAMAATLTAAGLASFRPRATAPLAMPAPANPSELKPALLFVVLYAVVLLGSAMAQQYFGTRGLYVVAALSGLADMDAITLSLSHLVTRHEVAPEVGWRLVLVAAMANLAFKAGIAWVLGDRRVARGVAVGFGVAAFTGSVLLLCA